MTHEEWFKQVFEKAEAMIDKFNLPEDSYYSAQIEYRIKVRPQYHFSIKMTPETNHLDHMFIDSFDPVDQLLLMDEFIKNNDRNYIERRYHEHCLESVKVTQAHHEKRIKELSHESDET